MPPLSQRSSSPSVQPSKRCSDAVCTINSSMPSNVLLWKDRQRKQLSRLGEALSGPSRAIAPMAIIGGTFSVYSSAIQLSASSNNLHSIQQFTPASILYLLLLALNYAIMPRLSKRYIHPNANKRSVALVEEVVKMSLGLGGWVLTGYASAKNIESTSATQVTSLPTTMSVLQEQLQHWSPLSTLIAAGLPSALYALQGTLTYTAYQNLDAVTYNGLTQLKVLSSALCCYVILNKRQSVLQMVSLGLLMLSSVVFQGSWKDWIRKQTTSGNHSNNIDNSRVLLMGVLPCLTATLLSGLAGAFSQRSLQTQVGGQMHRDAYFYTVEISFLSAACLVISMTAEYWQGRRTVACASVKELHNKYGTKKDSFFQYWTYATLLPITTRATAGLLTALVHRHLGSVVKGFALVLGLVFSALLQFVLEGVDLSVGQLIGTALVLFSSWLHFKG
mmetsp:Transcript_14348/g.20359  ORF Transcript_14348/g.20359 Transcript_14348/m.20359 type:complete len:446 (-) Transcript_14348:92-1429(-)